MTLEQRRSEWLKEAKTLALAAVERNNAIMDTGCYSRRRSDEDRADGTKSGSDRRIASQRRCVQISSWMQQLIRYSR